MINNGAFKLNIQIIINKNLYLKKIIDEKTYERVYEKLLKKLKNYNF